MAAACEIRTNGFSLHAVTISAKMIAEKCDPLGDSYEKCDFGVEGSGRLGGGLGAHRGRSGRDR